MPHLLDSLAGLLYRFGPGSTRVFPEGWGDRLTVEMLADSSSLTSAPVPAADTVWGRKEERVGLRVIRGQFTSPVAELLPPAARVVPVELLEPAVGSSRVVVLLPAWNDHGFDQRRKMAHHLVEHGIASLMLDIPFYGARRTTSVQDQAIRTVADFALMGFGAVQEAKALLAGLDESKTAGVAGFSMGGNLAAIVSAVYERPVAVAALAASHSPGPVYLDGVLRHAIRWDALGGREQAPLLREVLTAASALAYPARPHHRSGVVLAASGDAFVPAIASEALAQHWDAELRIIPGGHATALWRNRPTLATAIRDAFERFERFERQT